MELKVLWGGRSLLARRPRTYVTLTATTLLVVAAFAPWSTTIRIPAVAGAAADAALFPRAAGQVESVRVRPGAEVAAGDVLLALRSPDIDNEARAVALRIAMLERRRGRTVRRRQGDRSEWVVLGRQLEAETRRAAALAAQREDLVLRAPVAGGGARSRPGLRPGVWVGVRTPVARVVGPSRARSAATWPRPTCAASSPRRGGASYPRTRCCGDARGALEHRHDGGRRHGPSGAGLDL